MFEHSVKVPRHYKIASKIFKTVSTDGGSVKSLLYDNKLRHFRTDVLYALITETIKHAADIDKIFEHSKLLENEPRFDPWLAKVLTAELLFGKKSLPGKSKPEQTILSYKEQFDKYASEHQDDLKTEVIPRPRYVRINTNLLTTSDAIRAFQDEGYKFIRCTSGSYNDYLEQIKKLTEEEFTQDYHVKTIFVFAPGTKWHNHELYLANQIILQDKATALAVHLLAPPAGSSVLDMCAAPGMKTTQLAAYMRNNGKIYAVERNPQRYETLCDFVEKTASKCVETFNRDSLDIKRGEFEDVEYILLDPSCSGSGMTMSVHNYGPEQNRLDKLTSLQEKFLKHAMNSFPKAKRIVYSTCSLYPEENERVIANVVKMSRAKWRVQNVKELLKDQWNNMGSAMYGSTGTRCLYAKPQTDMTTGFFLAVLDRDEKDLVKALERKENEKKALKKDENEINQDTNVNENSDDSKEKKTIKKKKKNVTEESIVEETNSREIDSVIKPKTKKKKYQSEDSNKQTKIHENGESNQNCKSINTHIDSIGDLNSEDTGSLKKKKKKKDKHNSFHSGYDIANSTKYIPEPVNIIDNNLEDLNVNDQDIEAPKKKKKKKDKYNSLNTNNSNDTQNTENQEHMNIKKNKKRKHENVMEEDYELIENNPETKDKGNSKKSKKKKKKHLELNT